MNGYTKVYKQSGIIGQAAYLVPISGIIGSIILSFAYAYINVYSPIAGYISILFVVGFGFGVGFVVSLAGDLGKCRNPIFLNLVGFLISLFALYSSWVIFIYALLNKASDEIKLNLIDMFLSPGKIWYLVKTLNQAGWYSIKTWTPSGTVLWIFWGIEAVIIIAIVTAVSASAVSSRIFCERCSKWSPALEPFQLAFPQDASLQEMIKKGDIGKLEELERVSPSESPHLSVELFGCDSCRQTAGFKLKVVTVEVDKDGQKKEDGKDFSPLFTLPYQQFEQLKTLAERPIKESPPPPPQDADKGR